MMDKTGAEDATDRPLSDPNALYGWRCAQILGYDNYKRTVNLLDETALDGYNRYVAKYLANNSVNYAKIVKSISKEKKSMLPTTDWKVASEIIKRNANAIKNAGDYYGVNPAIIAACIYTEQVTNVNILDSLTDVPAFFADTSIGIGQVKVSTAKMLEDEGYIQKTVLSDTYNEWHGNNFVKKEIWHAPVYGYVVGSREKAIAYRLTVESENVNYVAAYLRYFQDRWVDAYPEIDGKTDILATLYNQGEKRPPHSNPTPNPFGVNAKKEYYYMRQLLVLD
ncbi:MAG: hypothetical protein IJD36_01975 [Clostridia bacterium]|nr:hypothetical protein [Clostridia bacterium]